MDEADAKQIELIAKATGEGIKVAAAIKDEGRIEALNMRLAEQYIVQLGNLAKTTNTVIAMEPDILALDEPAANLDPKSRRSLIAFLKTFTHSKMIASHDLDLVLDVCERCIVIGNGRVVADGPSAEILSNRTLLEENSLELPLSLQKR